MNCRGEPNPLARDWQRFCPYEQGSLVRRGLVSIESLETMATYSREDFDQIAAAIHVDVARVYQNEKQFEAAALWYRLDCRVRERQTPFVMHRRMTQIVNTARRLLRQLEIEDPSQAPDGPGI